MEFSARYTLAGLFVLAAIFGFFAFIYWLVNSASIGETMPYRIRFPVPVAGLSQGSDVLFNGIKVGRVTALRFDRDRPDATIADIELAKVTPVRADTRVGIAFQGLTGAASILMTGGGAQAAAPPADADGVPVLEADPAASRSWTDNAGRVLGRLDQMLARNSDRFDAIMSGLERLAGGGSDKESGGIYDLPVPQFPSGGAHSADWQLAVSEPTVLLSLNTDKAMALREDGSLAPLASVRWTDNLPNLVQAKLIQAFENAGYADQVLRPADLFEPQYRLAIDIRDFHLSLGGSPYAQAEMMAKLIDRDGKVVASKMLSGRLPAETADGAGAVDAMRRLFASLAQQLVEWTVAELQTAQESQNAE